jgi:leader peptidase (prepilin peptidase) / N-methyltransferase
MNGWLLTLDIYLGLASIALTYFDLKFHRLPNLLTLGSYPLVAAFLFADALTSDRGFDRLARAGLAALAYLLVFVVLHLINRSGMGLGDVKLAPIIGAVTGWVSWNAVITSAFYAFIAAGLVAGVLLLTKRSRDGDDIAFGPFMLLGMWLAILQIG